MSRTSSIILRCVTNSICDCFFLLDSEIPFRPFLRHGCKSKMAAHYRTVALASSSLYCITPSVAQLALCVCT
eukprot:jgi/Mesvir1/3349/Mv26342-RA.1